jgi:nucleotide-binding universal stress UspA family protein
MYDGILVPTDGSETAAAALDHAVDLAERYGATLHLLHVVESAMIPPTPAGGEVLDRLSAHGDSVVNEAREGVDDRVPVETAVAEGSPHRAILDYTADADIDLVVMGTHGRTGLQHALLGSVAERVVRLADVPVLTVRHPDAAAD